MPSPTPPSTLSILQSAPPEIRPEEVTPQDHPLPTPLRAVHRPERLPHSHRTNHRHFMSRRWQWETHTTTSFVPHARLSSSLGICGTDPSCSPSLPVRHPFLLFCFSPHPSPIATFSHGRSSLNVGLLTSAQEDEDFGPGQRKPNNNCLSREILYPINTHAHQTLSIDARIQNRF